MPLYELKQGLVPRFWEITLADNTLTLRWGTLGTPGQARTLGFHNAAMARRESTALIAEKTKEGYVLAPGQISPAMPVRAPVEAPPDEPPPGPLPRDPELEAAIEKDPDHLDTYLVYADWLQARGSPHGELIALQCAAHRATGAQARKLQSLSDELLREHEDLLLGGLVGLRTRVSWRLGFINELSPPAKVTTRSGRELKAEEFLRRFLALPAARFVKRLNMRVSDDFFDYEQFIEALGSSTCPTVETLVLGDEKDFVRSPSRRTWNLGPIRLSEESFPSLRSLTLCGELYPRHVLRGMNLPELRELRIFSGASPDYFLEELAYARLPKLERLVLDSHPSVVNEGFIRAAALEPLLDALRMPHLKHLGMRAVVERGPKRGGQLCLSLSRSKLLARLESLDVSHGLMTDAVAETWAAHAAAFQHLRQLDVRDNCLSPRGAARIATLCANVDVSDQRELRDEEELLDDDEEGLDDE